MKAFKNLVFDIGDVIIDIDVAAAVGKFQELAVVDFSKLISHSAQESIFNRFEMGKISAAEFRKELRAYLKPEVSDEEINAAWNSILVAYPPEKFALLKELKTRYRTFTLSNTNEIHIETFNESVKALFGQDFASFFHRTYYSHQLGFMKPHKEIYELVMQKENLIADETFFVDDKMENVEGAKAVGWHAYHLTDRNKLHDLLARLKII